MLTDIAIRAFKPAPKSYKRGDDKGLFILVHPSGSLLWRFKYRFYGQERALSFGKYPEVTLKMARDKRDEARAMLAEGIDPLADKQQKVLLASIAAATTFNVVADEYPHELLAALKRVERRGHHETAQRLRAFAGRVFRYAIATLRTDLNPADVLRGALVVPRFKHHAAILKPA